MATVIYANLGDKDTEVLTGLWDGMSNVKVVEINAKTNNAKKLVNEAIENEHDTLIMCGHGTGYGLLNPSYKDGTYLIDGNNYKKIKCNRVIGIWCHASDFAQNYGVKGFWSSMFISNSSEATVNQCYKSTGKTITEQEELFCMRLNKLIRNYVPMKTWVETLKSQADYSIDVVKFNYDGLRYYKKAPVPKITNYGYKSYRNYDWETRDWDNWRNSANSIGYQSMTTKPTVCDGTSTEKNVDIKKTSFKEAEIVNYPVKKKNKAETL